MNPAPPSPLLIVGCGRSGTTLLQSILGSHSQIHFVPETFFYPSVVGRLPATTTTDERLTFMATRWWLRDAGLDQARLEAAVRGSGVSTWAGLFQSLLLALAGDEPMTYVGEKTPAHVKVAHQLLSEMPDLRVIQIVRDPRAVLTSYRDVPVGTNQVAPVIAEWSDAIHAHDQLIASPRYSWLRYEELVAAPELVLRTLLEFLGLDFEPAMLEFHSRGEAGYAPEQGHHANTLQPIFQDSAGRWMNELSTPQVALIEHYLGGSMQRLGYACVAGPVSAPGLRMRVSGAQELVHRTLVRRPNQVLKARRATRRLDHPADSETPRRGS